MIGLIDLARRIGPGRIIVGALAAVAAVAVVLFIHDPFGLGSARRDDLRARLEAAQAEASARRLEAEGRASISQAAAAARDRQARATAVTSTLIDEARHAPDAAVPLDEARLARLRAHDLALCELEGLEGCESVEGRR